MISFFYCYCNNKPFITGLIKFFKILCFLFFNKTVLKKYLFLQQNIFTILDFILFNNETEEAYLGWIHFLRWTRVSIFFYLRNNKWTNVLRDYYVFNNLQYWFSERIKFYYIKKNKREERRQHQENNILHILADLFHIFS